MSSKQIFENVLVRSNKRVGYVSLKLFTYIQYDNVQYHYNRRPNNNNNGDTLCYVLYYLSVKKVAMHVTLNRWHKTAAGAAAAAAGGTDPYTRTVADHTDRLARPIPARCLSISERPVKGPTRARECACVRLSRLHRVYRRLIAVLHLSTGARWRNARRAAWLSRRYLAVIGSPGPWSAQLTGGRRSRFATLTLSRQIGRSHHSEHSSYKWMGTYFAT